MKSSKLLQSALLTIFLATGGLFMQAADQPVNLPPEGQTLHIQVGKSVIIHAPSPVTRVLASNPAVVDALGITSTQVVVEGKSAGVSSLVLWDQNGHSELLDVTVDMNVSGLRSAIERGYPGQNVEVQTDGGRIILAGTLTDPRFADELVKMAGQYSKEIVNSFNVVVPHDRQVLLEVKFAEVDRTRIEQLGFNIFSTGAGNTPGSISTQQFGPPLLGGGSSNTGTLPGKLSLSTTDLLNIFVFRQDLNLGMTIKALQQKNALQILAEPNLMALNGQKASFLSGGEFPFPVVQGGANVGAVTIQFRPFGVRLDFTPMAGADNVIRLHVAPEVSSLDFTNALTLSGFVVPAIATRKAETEIELRDGQSFAIAGLIDHRATVQLSKVPGIGDIPILGQLFHSKNINLSNTELLVLVTAHIVDPVKSTAPPAANPKTVVPFLDNPKFDQGVAPKNGDETSSPSAK